MLELRRVVLKRINESLRQILGSFDQMIANIFTWLLRGR
jgi:hypothetical protein